MPNLILSVTKFQSKTSLVWFVFGLFSLISGLNSDTLRSTQFSISFVGRSNPKTNICWNRTKETGSERASERARNGVCVVDGVRFEIGSDDIGLSFGDGGIVLHGHPLRQQCPHLRSSHALQFFFSFFWSLDVFKQSCPYIQENTTFDPEIWGQCLPAVI